MLLLVGEVVVHCLGKTVHENNSPHPLFSGRQGSHISRCHRPALPPLARTPRNIFLPPDLSRSRNLRSPEQFQWLQGKHLQWDLAHIFSCSPPRLFADLEKGMSLRGLFKQKMLIVFAYHPFQARTWFQTYHLNRPGLSLSSPPAKVFTQASFLLLVTFVLKSGQMRSQVLPSGIYCPGWPPGVGFLEKHKCKSGSWGKRAIFLPYFHYFLPNSQEIPYQSVRKEGDKVLHTILCLAGHLEIVRPMTHRFQSPAVSLLDVTSLTSR